MHGNNSDQDRQEVHEHWMGDDPDDNENKESSIEVGSQWEGDEEEYV